MNSLTYIRIVSEASMANSGMKIITLVHVVLLMISYFSLCASVEGRKISTQNTQKQKNAITTIRTENGDILDCVSLYKQPAFDHPLLKNHKIQIRPSWYPERMQKDASESENNDTNALEIVHCPDGTIPILRTPTSITQLNLNATSDFSSTGIQDAYFWLNGRGIYLGIESGINVWNPAVASKKDDSGVYMWVQAGNPGRTRYVDIAAVGWTVSPAVYGDYGTRLTIFWTNDNFQSTGCQDLFCPGFMQVNRNVAIGGTLATSRYGQVQRSIHVSIYKAVAMHARIQDQNTGHWWMQFGDTPVGYWPNNLFSETGLRFAPEMLAWGGRVTNRDPFLEQQTYTEMGSGHFPGERYAKACYIRNMQAVYGYNFPVSPRVNDLQAQITNPACYDATKGYDNSFGTHMYVGGSGGSGCQ